MIIYSNKIYTEEGLKDGFLELEDGKFKAFYPKSENLKADADYTGKRILPGIIDTHNHGGFGFDMAFGDGAPIMDHVEGYLKGQASNGVTGVFPTSTNVEAIRLFSTLAFKPMDGATIVGIHSEGPWGARVGEKGVNTGYPKVDLKVAEEMVKAGNGYLKLVDIAPEVEGAIEAIKYFKDHDVFVGAYHTSANYKEANLGIDAGISVATHLGNVMTGLHHRDIGVLGACLNRDEVDCEIICDGLHVCLDMIALYFRLKDYSRFIMISDNVKFAELPVGHYKGSAGNENSDRKTIYINEEGFVLSETGRLSGSSKPVIYGIKNLVEVLNIPLETVVQMSSLNPARKYGLSQKGSIKVGKDADFIVIDDDYKVLKTYAEGRLVWDAETEKVRYNEEYLKDNRID